MRLGLLVCDHVMPQFVEVAGDYDVMFGGLLNGVELAAFDLTAMELPADLDAYDGWITTGSKLSVYDDEPWVHAFADLVRLLDRERRRLVGVCFGHQMIAHALGGKVIKSDQGWRVGIKEVDIVNPQSWMEPVRESFRVLNSHQDQVVDLPAHATLVGSNEHCPVSMMTVGDHFLGIQGHPEFVPEYSRALMEARRGIRIPEEVVDEGLASLNLAPDRELLAKWMLDFLAG